MHSGVDRIAVPDAGFIIDVDDHHAAGGLVGIPTLLLVILEGEELALIARPCGDAIAYAAFVDFG